jgi:hypothetical protein
MLPPTGTVLGVDMNNNAMAGFTATETLDDLLIENIGLTYTGRATLGKQQAGGNSWAKSQ